jgi:S1-C subfamily serine protease
MERLVSVNVMRLLICSILFSASLFSFTFTPAIGQEANQTAAPDGRGAGFIIGNAGQVLTTARAVDGCDDVQAKMHGKTATALVVARDAVNDLALLKLDGPVPNGPAIRTTAPQMGEQIVTLAFVPPGWAASTARGGEANSTEGAVTALTGSTSSSTNDTRLLQISEPVRQNDSGGPLLDRSGHVIGVVSWRRGAPESDRGLAIKAAIVQAFLDAHGISYRTSGPSSPLEAADIAGEAKGYTFTIECIKRPRFVSETPPQAIKRESAAVNTPTHDK